ncbi:MAG: hypothetical protein QF673_01035 [Candidatus Hydrothermarchaeota archaeon]|jgi:hypothetical protein|nr:hypothetical protein [Candidatus Hydrothermarchaeota archaeon]MDP6612585.1 hypothetical protein [Candidatus Hydrothermarchaeota archaeon]
MLFLVGLGGAGCRVIELFYRKGVLGSLISRISASGDEPVRGVAIDTSDALEKLISIPIKNMVLIGKHRTKGHGAGSDITLGNKILTEEYELAMNVLTKAGFKKADVIFLIAGLGGGTGTGGFPVLAEKIKEIYRIPVIGVYFLPSRGEGALYSKNAKDGFSEAVKAADGVIILDNNALTSMGEVITNAYQALDEAVFNFLSSVKPSTVFKLVNGKTSSVASMEVKAEPTALKDLIRDLLRNHLYIRLGKTFESLFLIVYGDRRKIYGQGLAEDWIKEKFGAKLTYNYRRPLNSKVIRCDGIITGMKGLEKRLAVEVQKREVASELQSLLEDINPI